MPCYSRTLVMEPKHVSRSQLSQKVISHHAVLSSITRTSSHFSGLLFTTNYFDLYSHILSSWFVSVCYCRVLILILHQKNIKGSVFVLNNFVNRTQLNHSHFSERFSVFRNRSLVLSFFSNFGFLLIASSWGYRKLHLLLIPVYFLLK